MKTIKTLIAGFAVGVGLIIVVVIVPMLLPKPDTKPRTKEEMRAAIKKDIDERTAEAPRSNPETRDTPDMVDMQVAAERVVRNGLKAPSTAKFPGFFEQSAYQVVKTEKGTYIMKAWVDAQNSFGAMIRNDWYVEFERDGNSWRPVNFELAAR